MKYEVCERYADNGGLSHHELIDSETGETVIECIEEANLFRDSLMAIMSDCYRDGHNRASMGLFFDFEYSRTKLLIERGNYYYAQGKTLPELLEKAEG